MRLAILGCILLLGMFTIFCISFMLFLRDNPSISKRLNKRYGGNWKQLLESSLYEKSVNNSLNDSEERLLEYLMSDSKFERYFNTCYLEKNNPDKKLRDIYLQCCRLIEDKQNT